MTKRPHKTVAIYTRVSTDKQKVDMQLNELRQFVARSGWTIHREYIDQGLMKWKGGLNAMLAAGCEREKVGQL